MYDWNMKEKCEDDWSTFKNLIPKLFFGIKIFFLVILKLYLDF
jgi:hypothetical protein